MLGDNRVSIPFERESAFKRIVKSCVLERVNVSIPFERESAFKQRRKNEPTYRNESFNSLRAGKRVQTFVIRGRFRVTCWKSFNSLRAGKRVQTIYHIAVLYGDVLRVSIPFERESAFKPDQ